MPNDNTDTLALLQTRNSHARLAEPGPTREEIETMVMAGMRAPDHGLLRPWRFVAIEGDARVRFADVLIESNKLLDITDEAKLQKAEKAPLRAPLILAVLLAYQDHPKIDRNEQIGSAAAAAYAVSLAANALGYGTMWRTGAYAMDPYVIGALGGKESDEVIGFIYIGTREGPEKPLPELDRSDFLSFF